MRVHYLNCGTFCPPARPLVNGHGTLLDAGHLTCLCILIEGNDGLVLIDTGLGLADLTDPVGRIGPTWCALMRPEPDPDLSAVRQIEELGFYADDVRHIVLTHLDFDHAGGLPDFPHARIHVFEDEFQAAQSPHGIKERFRYKPHHWAHFPDWVRYRLEGERWFGFDGVRALGDTETEVLLIPLKGHSRGHCGVAVKTPEGWLLNAGDAYFSRSELENAERRCPPLVKAYERFMQTDRGLRVENQRRLAELDRREAGRVRIVCSHDPSELMHVSAGAVRIDGVRSRLY